MPSNKTKTMQVTIPYTLFNQLVMELELDNQDELDNCIQSLIERELDYVLEKKTIDDFFDTTLELRELSWINKLN